MPFRSLPGAIGRAHALTVKAGDIREEMADRADANRADTDYSSGMDMIAPGRRDPRFVKGRDTTYDDYAFPEWQPRTGRLSYALLRKIYERSSYVRPCVDALVRSVSSLPWVVRPFKGGDPRHANQVSEFLRDPNSNEESLRKIFGQVLTDVMVIDEGIIEKVRSLDGTLLELFARDGATFIPIKDVHGILYGYVQKMEPYELVKFSKDEVMYFELYPTTWSAYGLPIIETIVNEIASLMFSVQWIADSFTEDKIPPGILVLDHIAKDAYDRAKTEFQSGEDSQFTVKLFRNVGKAEWIELKKSNAEMQLAELNQQIERIVYRNFGLQPFELGVTSEINRATAEMALRVSQSRVFKPLIQMVNYAMNQNLVRPVYRDVYFKLIPMDLGDPLTRAQTIAAYVKQGILTKGEARMLIEDEFFVEGGLSEGRENDLKPAEGLSDENRGEGN